MELQGQVEGIIYQNEANSYTIANLDTDNEEITIVGYLPFIREGDTLRVREIMWNIKIMVHNLKLVHLKK